MEGSSKKITEMVNTLVYAEGGAAIHAMENNICVSRVNFESEDAIHPDIALQQTISTLTQEMNLDGFLFFEIGKKGNIHFTGRM